MLRKQKRQSSRRKSIQDQSNSSLIKEYRNSIVPVEFSLREIETYSSLSSRDLQNIEISSIQQDHLKELVVDCLKLSFIYDPLKETLDLAASKYFNHHQLKTILKILSRGEFYRFIRNTDNQIKILVNNRTTQSNVKILIAALMIYGCRKLNLEEISTSMLFFALQAALNPDSQSIAGDSQKIVKVLKKIERVIKPTQFKAWFQAVKNNKEYTGEIQAHHFLYLVSMSQKRFSHGLQNIIQQPKIASLFKNLNNHVKAAEFDTDEAQEITQKKKIVKGLSFVEPRKRQSFSLSKEILKEFRLRNPSKNKRPDTGYLRSRVQSFCLLPANKQRHTSLQQKSITYNSIKPKLLNDKMVNSVGKLTKATIKLRKPEFKLKLHR